jgi:hypothetical protein
MTDLVKDSIGKKENKRSGAEPDSVSSATTQGSKKQKGSEQI